MQKGRIFSTTTISTTSSASAIAPAAAAETTSERQKTNLARRNQLKVCLQLQNFLIIICPVPNTGIAWCIITNTCISFVMTYNCWKLNDGSWYVLYFIYWYSHDTTSLTDVVDWAQSTNQYTSISNNTAYCSLLCAYEYDQFDHEWEGDKCV